ncbi:MAG: hypothetical protein WC707_06340 [Candidatus Babeliaceae bacterium]|jgi:hypothetical protein
MKKLLLLCTIATNFGSLHSMSTEQARQERLAKLHDAASGYFFGGDRFTRNMNSKD